VLLLPHEKRFVGSEGLVASGKQMLAHLRSGQLLATYAVGFGVLFNFILTFTYVSFHLAASPYNLSAGAASRSASFASGRSALRSPCCLRCRRSLPGSRFAPPPD